MRIPRCIFFGIICLFASVACSGAATDSGTEQEYGPYKDGDVITMVLGSSPGGGFDTAARLMQPYLEEALQEQSNADITVVVENKPGASHRVATEYVARSKPDGKTFLFSIDKDIVGNDLFNDANYDALALTPLASAGAENRGIIATKGLGLTHSTLPELIDRAQQTPLRFASNVDRADVRVMLGALREGGAEFPLNQVHLGDASTGELAGALLRGDVQVLMTTASSLKQYVDDNPNELQFIASLGCEREEDLSNISTIVEQDVPNAQEICESMGGYYRTFVGPPGMRGDRLESLQQSLESVLTNDEYVEKVSRLGIAHDYMNPQEVMQQLENQLEAYKKRNTNQSDGPG